MEQLLRPSPAFVVMVLGVALVARTGEIAAAVALLSAVAP
jgi:hypothetical protein